MTIAPQPADNSGRTTSLADAALAYAASGIPIVVFDATIGNGKQCGNLVGNADDPDDRWYDHATTDPAVIREWLDRFGARATGIATSPGKADAVVLDVDKSWLVSVRWLLSMDRAPFQATDENDPQRGHYWFDLPPGERFGNPSFDWGEIRCDGGGLILWPTSHARAAEGGRYHWVRQGRTPVLPEVIASALRARNNGQPYGHADTDHQGRGVKVGATQRVADADVEAFCKAHQGNDRPKALDNLTNRIRRERNVTRNMVRDFLRLAAQEARAGLYPYQRAIDEIRKAAVESYEARAAEGDNRAIFDKFGFDRLVINGIEQASLKTLEQCADEANRAYQTRHDAPINNVVAGRFDNWSPHTETDGNAKDTGNAESMAGEKAEGSDCTDPEHEAEVQKQERRLRALSEAQKRIRFTQWADPDDEGDLAYQFDNPEPEPDQLVENLIPANGIVSVVAQNKAGKTTLASVNLTYALTMNKPFLNRFPVHFDDDECVGVWNFEVDQRTFNSWLSQTGIDSAAQKRVFPKHLRGNRTIDFDNEPAVDWTVNWLRERNIKVWIIDPQSKLYRGEENANTEFNHWWQIVEDITKRAGVRVTVIVHHTGHSDGASARARGASAMGGNPDVLISYWHSGDSKSIRPPDNKRFLEAFGRNVEVPEFEIDFDPATQKLIATNSGMTRRTRELHTKAVLAWEYLDSLGAPPQDIAQTALLTGAGLPNNGNGLNESKEALAYAKRQGWVVMAQHGRALRYSTGTASPPRSDRTWRFSPVITRAVGVVSPANGVGAT